MSWKTTRAARIEALQDFVSTDEADGRRERKIAGRIRRKWGDAITRSLRVLDFLVFRLIYVCPTSVTVRWVST